MLLFIRVGLKWHEVKRAEFLWQIEEALASGESEIYVFDYGHSHSMQIREVRRDCYVVKLKDMRYDDVMYIASPNVEVARMNIKIHVGLLNYAEFIMFLDLKTYPHFQKVLDGVSREVFDSMSLEDRCTLVESHPNMVNTHDIAPAEGNGYHEIFNDEEIFITSSGVVIAPRQCLLMLYEEGRLKDV